MSKQILICKGRKQLLKTTECPTESGIANVTKEPTPAHAGAVLWPCSSPNCPWGLRSDLRMYHGRKIPQITKQTVLSLDKSPHLRPRRRLLLCRIQETHTGPQSAQMNLLLHFLRSFTKAHHRPLKQGHPYYLWVQGTYLNNLSLK